jgi:2-dehydro-3-deoxyphosphogluconate aldolase / (4S)-4-hydroxy-2-oxoglutarate aldolase
MNTEVSRRPVGGVGYLKELRGPLPDVAIIPTGGVTLEDALLGGDLTALAARGEQLMSSVSRFREELS